MNVNECIEMARKAHERLRARTAGIRPDERSSAVYNSLKSALDEIWAAAEQRPDMKQIRSAIEKLTSDAEFFAGLNDSEGFRDAAEVWQQYAYLKHAVGVAESQ